MASHPNFCAVEIERGVPIPASNSRWPFAAMEVGDSFSAPAEEYKRLTVAATYHGRKADRKFMVRKQAVGYRCWRIA